MYWDGCSILLARSNQRDCCACFPDKVPKNANAEDSNPTDCNVFYPSHVFLLFYEFLLLRVIGFPDVPTRSSRSEREIEISGDVRRYLFESHVCASYCTGPTYTGQSDGK